MACVRVGSGRTHRRGIESDSGPTFSAFSAHVIVTGPGRSAAAVDRDRPLVRLSHLAIALSPCAFGSPTLSFVNPLRSSTVDIRGAVLSNGVYSSNQVRNFEILSL